MKKNPLILLFLIFIYATTQIIWWTILIIKFDPALRPMVYGEAFFFILFLSIGGAKLRQIYNENNQLSHRQGNFLLSVTHELKSPLASVKLYLETLLKRNLDREKQETFLKNSLRDVERLHDLLENMLLATRYENEEKVNINETFNFSEITKNIIIRLQQNVCLNKQITYHIAPNIEIQGDTFALCSVVTNLIENAIKYSPENENIHVDLEVTKNNIFFRVSDNGIGIADEEKYRIFDKFYRIGSENTRSTKGTGLGLYIVKQVLDTHNGHITVRNNIPKGSIFEVNFIKNVE